MVMCHKQAGRDWYYAMAFCTTKYLSEGCCVAMIAVSPEVKYRKRRGDQGQPVPGGSGLVR